MMDLDKIAGRMLDLESKYYELQEKYQLLIHHYEDLKAEYEAAERSGHWCGLTDDEIDYATAHTLSVATKNNLKILIRSIENKLKDRNEAYRARYRDNIRSQHDLDGCN